VRAKRKFLDEFKIVKFFGYGLLKKSSPSILEGNAPTGLQIDPVCSAKWKYRMLGYFA
jgi:hypothetical protein